MAGLRALNVVGLNVTIPHKVAVMSFLDKLDPLVERMGAVNTIVNDAGWLTGYNTDAPGFLQALRSKNIEPEGKNIVILGAGGASKGISFILAGAGASLVILNRTLSRAEELAAQVSQAYQRHVEAVALNEKNMALSLIHI